MNSSHSLPRRNVSLHHLPAADEFLMYTYKVRRCQKTRSHDWTDCPYAHRGEKARRRDPTEFPYNGIACPEFRQTGDCRRGQSCEYAHGVFEFWLHPTRYRTRVCEAGQLCPRRVCFFAHTPEQLRPEVIRDCFCCELRGHAAAVEAAEDDYAGLACGCEPGEGGGGRKGGGRGGGGGEELPDIGWVFDLVM